MRHRKFSAAAIGSLAALIAALCFAPVAWGQLDLSEEINRSPANVPAGEVIVTPGASQGWAEANQQGTGASVISGDQPRSGIGSLDQSLSVGGSDKTDYEIFSSDIAYTVGEGISATAGGFGLVGSLSATGVDWYRDSSSTAAEHYTPAVRLWVWDPDAGGAFGTSYLLIWEGVYNGYPSSGGPVPTDTWVGEDMFGDFYWRVPQFINGVWAGIGYCNSNPTECFVFNNTIGDWGFGANTVVIGVNVGLGSGWDGSYQGYLDNVTLGFSEPTVWNFELDAVPSTNEIGLAMLFALLATSIVWVLRR